MPDRKQVIWDIERCICHVPDACRDCSKYEIDGANCMETLMADALALLKEQETGGWISVKDGTPPEMYKAVLGYAPYHNNIWAVTMRENGEWYIWSPQSKRYDPDWEGPITHWMPLPDPPKEIIANCNN